MATTKTKQTQTRVKEMPKEIKDLNKIVERGWLKNSHVDQYDIMDLLVHQARILNEDGRVFGKSLSRSARKIRPVT
jgi:hypothetical protein